LASLNLRKQLLDGNAAADSDLVKTLDIIIRTCRCYDMSSAPEAKKLRQETGKMESWKWNAIKCNWAILLPDASFHLIVDWS
jgi:hypothetical protein